MNSIHWIAETDLTNPCVKLMAYKVAGSNIYKYMAEVKLKDIPNFSFEGWISAAKEYLNDK